ncbi:MAG: radical SAM protein [Rectinemataceae bacterium]
MSTEVGAEISVGEAAMPRLREGRVIIPAVEKDLANPEWDRACARILIVRLSAWSDVDISSPHLVLFAETRSALPDAYIDFAFLPPAPDRAALDRAARPWFFGRASGRSPADFDLVMVSNAFALELLNLPYLFATSGLPATSRLRAELDRCPIVILGGSNASCTGALVRREADLKQPAQDSIPDGIFFGEGETAIGELAKILCGKEGRAERLSLAASVEGFWPCLVSPGAGRRTPGPELVPLLSYPVLNGQSASTVRLAITSGCPGFCSFCLEGWDRRPYRELPLDRVLDAARRLRRDTGADTLDVYSFNFNTHEDIESLIFELNRIFRRVSFMSQRLDILARSPGLARLEMAGGKKSFTLGIEGISDRMRAYYRKGLTETDLEACVEALLVPGVKEIKLFYIIAGTETEADLKEFEAFAAKLSELRAARAPSVRFITSAGFLVRLPFTPLQFAPLTFDEQTLKRLSARIGEACWKAGIEYRQASDFEEYCVDQCLAMDRGALLDWLVRLPEKGFVYDASLPAEIWPSMRGYLRSLGLPDDAYTGEKPADWRPPLEFQEPEIRHEILRRHYEEARSEVDRLSCLGGQCSDCDACGETADRADMLRHSPPRHVPQALIERTSRLLAAKATFSRIRTVIEIPPELAYASEEYRRSWILRRISALKPGSERFVFAVEELAFVPGTPFADLLPQGWGRWGAAAIMLSGPDEGKLREVVSVLDPKEYDAVAWRWVELSLELPHGNGKAAMESLSPWLEKAGVAHAKTTGRDGGIRLTASASASGRRILRKAEYSVAGETDILKLVVGEKAMLGTWLKNEVLSYADGSVRVVGPN